MQHLADALQRIVDGRPGLWNEAFFERIEIRDGELSDYRLAAPFGSLVSGSNNEIMVVYAASQ